MRAKSATAHNYLPNNLYPQNVVSTCLIATLLVLRCWQDDAKDTTFAQSAFNQKPATMAIHDMLDNGQAEPGAAHLSRAVAVNSVKPFGQPRYMQRVYSGSGIAHADSYGFSAQCRIMSRSVYR